jgi:hypothetical protein
LLAQENALNPRAKSLIGLCEASARSLRGADQPLDATLARDLVATIAASIGPAGAGDMARVLSASGREHVREAARANDPLVRAVAAMEIAKEPSAEDLAVLQDLLADAASPVQIAAVLALGDNKVESARTELLLRARGGDPKLRAAALEACGRLGGEGVFDALLIGLHDDQVPIQVAAARGLASLADPKTARLLVDLLGKGRGSPLFEPAREGLLKLGESAMTEILRVARQSGPAQREAALLLSQACAPDAAPILITLLTENENDALAASELAILTGVDLRSDAHPANAWWSWWDGVVHDDSMAWFRAALERAGVAVPPAEAFKPGGSRAELDFLLAAVARPEAHFAERARRELSRLAGRDLGQLPAQGVERDAWIAALREKLATRWP